MDLSVVIVSWNTRELLRACLASLRESLAASSLQSEVIVVDNASADGTAGMVAREFPEVRLEANTENRNYAAGNNQGLRLAQGDFILLLNPDTVAPVGAPDALIADLADHPRAGMVAPALVLPDGRIQDSVRGFPSPRALAGEILRFGRRLPGSEWASYFPRDLPLDRVSPVDQPMTSALLVRKAALDEVGLFDEQFPLFFNDVDLCYRLTQAGWEILYDPRVRIAHHHGASTRQLPVRAVLLSHEGLRRFYAKHYRRRLPWPAYHAIVISILLTGWLRAGLTYVTSAIRNSRGNGTTDGHR